MNPNKGMRHGLCVNAFPYWVVTHPSRGRSFTWLFLHWDWSDIDLHDANHSAAPHGRKWWSNAALNPVPLILRFAAVSFCISVV
jgi:hypothetical protein